MAYNLQDLYNKYGSTQISAGQNNPLQTAAPSKSSSTGFGAYVSNVAHSAARLAGSAVSGIANAAIKPVAGLIGNASHNAQLGVQQRSLAASNATLQRRQDDLIRRYKTGALTKSDYQKGLRQLSSDAEKAHKQQVKVTKNTEQHYAGYGEVAKNVAGTAGVAATFLAPVAAPIEGVVGAGLAAKGANAAIKGVDASLGAGRGNIATKAVLNAVGTQPVVNQPAQIAKDLKEGKGGKAAVDTALLAAPIGIGAASKVIPKAGKALKEGLIGREGVLDEVFGKKALDAHLKAKPGDLAKLKQQELFTLNQPDVQKGKISAAEKLKQHYKDIGIDPQKVGVAKASAAFQTYAKNVTKLEKKHPELVVSADFRDALPKAIAAINKAGGPSLPATEKVAVVQKALDDAGITNPTVKSKLEEAIINSSGKVTNKDLKPIVQKIVVPTKVKLDKGFIATFGPKNKAELPSITDAKAAGELVTGKKALPVLGPIASGLSKAGLGVEDYSPKQLGIIKENFKTNVENRLPGDVVERLGGGKMIMDGLDELANTKQVTDYRQFTLNELVQKFELTKAEARAMRTALDDAFSSAPLDVRGLGNKVQDFNIKYNPAARSYSRLQSIARYHQNPFFKGQQVVEANTVGAAVSGGSRFTAHGKELRDTKLLMRESGFLPKQGAGYAGESVENTAGLTKVTAYMQPREENALARTLLSIANRDGKTVEELLKDDKTRQLLRTVVQHNSRGIGSSNLTKSLNLAIFPLAYNVKVTSLAARALAKQSPAVQFGVLDGIKNVHDFLQTDEGIKWQSKNSELVNLVNYFTPLNSIESIYQAVANKDPQRLGLLGGLPFGIVSRALEGQGVKPKSQPPYVDPKTGQVVPDKIPTSLRGRLAQFIRDVADTTFTFPGRQAGLGSKSDLINTLSGGVTKLAPGDYKNVDRSAQLPKSDARRSQILKAQSAPKVLPKPVSAGPGLPKPKEVTLTPIYKNGSSSRGKKTKTLARRPGQL